MCSFGTQLSQVPNVAPSALDEQVFTTSVAPTSNQQAQVIPINAEHLSAGGSGTDGQYLGTAESRSSIFVDFSLSGPFYEADVQNSFDWLFFDELQSGEFRNTQGCDPYQLQTNWSTTANTVPTVANEAVGSQTTDVPEQVAGSPLDRLAVPAAHLEETHEDRWPMFWRPEPIAPVRLTSLATVETKTPSSTFYQLPTVSPQHIKTFTELLGVPSEQWLWSGVDLTCFPAGEGLNQCIDQYFVHFHKVSHSHTITSSWLISTTSMFLSYIDQRLIPAENPWSALQ